MGCNNGWHLFEYSTPDIVQHLEYLANDTRILRMRLKLESEELWCFVDEGSLGGLVVLDISGNLGIEENEYIIPNPEIKLQNYPNPFNPETTISFNLTAEEGEDAELVIYNVKGQRIKQFSIDNCQSSIVWDGKDDNNKPVSSGIYFYKLIAGDYQKVKKMILLR